MSEATPDLLRCPTCGASNPAHAGWCGQCLTRFDAGEDHNGSGPPLVDVVIEEPDIRQSAAGPVWRCPACEERNPIEATMCARCGTPFASLFRESRSANPRRAPGKALALSCVLPGLGHWAAGKTGAGIARVILYAWTLGISVLLFVRPPAAGGTGVRMVAITFAVAAAAVWLLALLETMRLTEGDERPVVPPGALTWVSAALSAVLVAGLLGSALSARG